jgi:hypothetical protein
MPPMMPIVFIFNLALIQWQFTLYTGIWNWPVKYSALHIS